MEQPDRPMGDLEELLFAIEITLVGLVAGVLAIPYDSFELTMVAGGLALVGFLRAAKIL
ncbi:hypothetical protein SAMN06269185_1555 [Natronoarchaeum philippinense]|uniref:Uncharacterized protein n=1 Tax=Natronoarchaeum philippinense TaxID=558529 RepID=A0A285NT90_NATPI|nr:hypothetical protein [Natronoarchaeum philippinense]SNZ12217.1 hypothetical protein SAMN06269185_1555 [Natronoarchaeum philippinense]